MLGKLCPACLDKNVHLLSWSSGYRHHYSHVFGIKSETRARVCHLACHLAIAFSGVWTQNYKYTDGKAYESACTPSTGPDRSGRQPSPPRGCHRSPLSRQRVLRSKRCGPGQVRDVAKRSEGRSSGGGSRSVLWPLPARLLCHTGGVPARRPSGTAAAQARAEAPHKLNDEALAILLEAVREAGRMLKGEELAALLAQRCGIEAHPRSILRRLRPHLRPAEKKRR